MNLREHFLERDLTKASQEFKCVKDCLELVVENIEKGDMDKAKHHSIDLLKSLHEMTNMSFEKQRVDRLASLIPGMPTAVHIDIVRAISDE